MLKSEYRNTSACDFFLLRNTVGIEHVTLSRIALCYYWNSVTVILTAPSHQTYVISRAVTENIVTQSRGLVEFSVLKWLKLTQFQLLTHSLIEKRNFAMGKPTRSTKNEPLNIYFCAFRSWKCLHDYRRPTMKIPELRWCLTEITFNNPSQFPGMF